MSSVVVPAKFESGTYDMNDESHTDQSYPDSPIASVGHSGEAAASLPLTSEISETKSSESTNNFTLSKDETQTNKVSWSNSEGSTFDSESDHIGCGDIRSDLGYVAFDYVEQNENADACMSRRTSTFDSLPRLQNVDYFSEVQVASSISDDVSVIEFISKEATRSIFERRMVPLDVSARRKRLDDVSAFSSTKSASPPDSSYSKPPILNRRVPSKERNPPSLENVENRSTTDFGTHDHEVITTFFGLPRTVESSPVEPNGVPKRISAVMPKEDDISIITLPKTMLEISVKHRIHSLSTLGSISARSDSFGNFSLSYEDDGSCKVSRRKMQTNACTSGIHHKSEDTIEDGLVTRTTDRRIKDLKERLRKLQEVSDLKPGLGHLESGRQSQKKYPAGVLIHQIAKEAKIRPSKANISPQTPAYRADAVPTEVSPELESNDDDISTIACELHSQDPKYNLFDVELGAQSGPHLERSGLSRSTLCLQAFKYKASRVIRIGNEKAALAIAKVSNTLEQFQIYQVMQRQWRMYMQERPPTEKAIIAVMSLSCLVLFILLLSIVTT